MIGCETPQLLEEALTWLKIDNLKWMIYDLNWLKDKYRASGGEKLRIFWHVSVILELHRSILIG